MVGLPVLVCCFIVHEGISLTVSAGLVTSAVAVVQGERCASRPRAVLLICSLAIALCMAGLAHFRVQTNPSHLWVAPGSDAAKEKAAYEVNPSDEYRSTLCPQKGRGRERERGRYRG